ncbi:MAG: aminotransferase class V-fold PLP-dependent enzyme [Candidatus Eremiobacteraeota bacterium]|nr:aminotransferase class V-fold PLP-dependent enzyme [Candidatus Eremiobacteraeota bacterium]
MSYDIEALRRAEFPWAARGEAVYLNNASTGPLPARTVAAVTEFVARRAEPHRIADAELFATLARVRTLAAGLIGADAGEIACMPNTTYGLNFAARALPLGAGDVVLTFDGEFPANVYPWMALAERGIQLELLPSTPDGLPDEAALMRAIAERDDVCAVTVSWVQFTSGYRVDLAAIGAACRARGIWFVVDAIQGLGACTLDVQTTPIDVFACGGQKWLLAPWGTGFIYVRRELVPRLAPQDVGWLAVRGGDDFARLTDYDYTLRDDARRFEVLTLPFHDFAGLAASLDLLHTLGPGAVAGEITARAEQIVTWAASRDDVGLVTPANPEHRAGIVSLRLPAPAAASARLRAAGIAHSVREGAVRLSPHGYNTPADVDRALTVLDEHLHQRHAPAHLPSDQHAPDQDALAQRSFSR